MVRRKETISLLLESEIGSHEEGEKEEEGNLIGKVKDESKKLWQIAGPAIFSRIALYSINVITIAFSGHLGNEELAAMSIATTVILGFNFGLLLGMASALETLCGQAFGAHQHSMLGIYLQRSWIVLFLCSLLMVPMFIFATPILKLAGLTDEIATLTGAVAIWIIPQHFAMVFQLTLSRFLQCQMNNAVTAWAGGFVLAVHVFISWLFVFKLDLGLFAAALIMGLSWWLNVVLLFMYTTCGGCPLSWAGFSWEAFSGLWEFIKLSAASGVMLCLENWYYRVLILLAGYMKNAEIAVDALSICMNINGWQLMIPFAFFAATGVRVANELGAGNGKAAKFATIVAVVTSTMIGAVFFALILGFHDKYALIFTSNDIVIRAVDKLSILLAFTILLNSVQPILSGVAVGSGWQAYVAYINIGCYYLIGLPAGILMAILFNFGVAGIWSGMIGGTLIQTLILAIITIRCNWDMEAEKARTRLDKYKSYNVLEASDGRNGKAAKFATIVAVVTSTLIGVVFFILILGFHHMFALIFTSRVEVLKAVDNLSILLAFSILLNSMQPILSGVAVGSGWQAYVAYINIGCYYFIGLQAGILLAILFNFGVAGIWGGMIGGTLIQTLILAIITIRCDWDMEAEKARIRLDKYGVHNVLEASDASKDSTVA